MAHLSDDTYITVGFGIDRSFYSTNDDYIFLGPAVFLTIIEKLFGTNSSLP